MSSTAGGAISDRFGRKRLMVVGWLIYAAVYFGFAAAGRAWHAVALYASYGLYYGAFQGASTALVADLVPAARRGRAFGLLNAAIGVAAFPASLLAGWLWQRFGSPAPFVFGGTLALVAALWLARLPLPAPERTR
jgi:MFS family permease